MDYYKKLREKGGIDLNAVWNLIKSKIEACEAQECEYSVEWKFEACYANWNYPVSKQTWRGTGDPTNAFGKNSKISINTVMTTIFNDYYTAYKSRQYTEKAYCGKVGGGDIYIKNVEGFDTIIPVWSIPAISWLYYKYITCKDESYKEEFEEVFNEH